MNNIIRVIVLAVFVLFLSFLLPSCAGDKNPVQDGESTSNSETELLTENRQTTVNTTEIEELTQPENTTAEGQTEQSISAEYRFDCEKSSFSPGDSFSLVLNANCIDFCSGCCYVAFDTSVLTCTNVSMIPVESLFGVIDNEFLEDGEVIISAYVAQPIKLDFAQIAKLDFTVNENAREDTVSSVRFAEGTLCIVGLDLSGTEISDITDKTILSAFEFSIV